MLRRLVLISSLLACLVAGTQVWAQGKAPSGAAQSRPAWTELTPQQREALAPLAGQWDGMSADRKRKWLDIASKYPKLSPDGKAKLHARMVDFAKLTPQQRQTARENFQRAYELPLEQRESLVQEYKDLPPEKKKELSERSQSRSKAAKDPAAGSAK